MSTSAPSRSERHVPSTSTCACSRKRLVSARAIILRMTYAKEFTAPGPGVWELESTHMMRPVSRSTAAIFPSAAIDGFRAGMERYGMLLEYLEFAVVNGFIYICPRAVGAPRGAKGPPPKLIFK